jgi:hypothetical protein
MLCVDFDDNCQSFAFVKDGTGCKLYMQGVCTKSVDGAGA